MGKLAQEAYRLLKRVPKGKVTTYKALGNALGTNAYQAIGQIMRQNPYAPKVPCHRVVRSDGSIGGFMGKREGKEIGRKKEMLKKEGIEFIGDGIKNFERVLFNPKGS
jgi:methylated-DNA-[protein]-cysteine S-methyltransferase